MEAWFVSDGKSLWWIENKALMLEWKSVTLAPETVIKVVLVVDGIEGFNWHMRLETSRIVMIIQTMDFVMFLTMRGFQVKQCALVEHKNSFHSF